MLLGDLHIYHGTTQWARCYQKEAGLNADEQCTSVVNPAQQYESAAPTATSDRVCTLLTQCKNQRAARECSSTVVASSFLPVATGASGDGRTCGESDAVLISGRRETLDKCEAWCH